MAKDKKSFVFYCDWVDTFEALPKDKGYDLLMHILSYVNDENPTSDDVIVNAVFQNIKNTLKRDLKKYENRAEKSRLNGQKGGRPKKPKKPTGFSKNLTEPKKPDSDSVNVSVSDSDSVNDILLEKETKEITSKKEIAEEIVKSYHLLCPNLPKVQKLSESRIKACNKRLEENGKEELRQVLEMAGSSDFLNGKNSNSFQASFDWIMKPANFIKILEGNYKNKPNGKDRKISVEDFNESIEQHFRA